MKDVKPMNSSMQADQVLDLGEKGCGQLVMEIMLAMRVLEPGQTLKVIAYDPGAASDIAAWCRMTGNILKQPKSAQSESPQNQFFLQKG